MSTNGVLHICSSYDMTVCMHSLLLSPACSAAFSNGIKFIPLPAWSGCGNPLDLPPGVIEAADWPECSTQPSYIGPF